MSESDVESDDDKSNNEIIIKNSIANAITKSMRTTTPLSILVESLVKNLCSVYEPDEKNAKKLYDLICQKLYENKLIDESYKMIEFEVMRSQYERAFYQLVTAARGGKQPTSLHAFYPNTDITNDWSHYYKEFEELEYIAGGGFGQVYKVKHKLDGTQYAIKKINIRSEGITAVRNYLSEVKTFASLNHSNIVQYKAAWLELGVATSKNAITTNDHNDSEASSYIGNTSYNEDAVLSGNIYPHIISEEETSLYKTKNHENSDFEVNFVNSNIILESQQHSYSTEYNLPKKMKREKRSSISEGGNAVCTIEEIENIRMHVQHHPKWATLYIQMALCQSTLKQWLEKRNSASQDNDKVLVPIRSLVKNDTVLEILKQLLKGLEYIHSRNIVHHDIKPSNIFMQIENGTLLVQLGDFGLACPLQSVRHSLAFGTKLYAAPEQLAGKCDPKSDMYSLGIVLLELTETFKTDMERIHDIGELKKGNISAHLLVQQPILTNIMKQLVKKNPKSRPDAKTLLQKLTTEVIESDVIKSLKSQLDEKDREISRLKELLEKAGLKNV